MKRDLLTYYQSLIEEYGDPVRYWPQWCAKEKNEVEREKVIIGMILVQRTSWHNANIALKNLKSNNLLSVKSTADIKNLDELKKIIRTAGFYQTKPKTLFDVCNYIVEQGGVGELMKRRTEKIRNELLKIKGVGPETADTILLYALDKPVFIIDEYTRRWVRKNGLTEKNTYGGLQNFFQENLKPCITLYQNFHALIIISQRGREKSKMEVV